MAGILFRIPVFYCSISSSAKGSSCSTTSRVNLKGFLLPLIRSIVRINRSLRAVTGAPAVIPALLQIFQRSAHRGIDPPGRSGWQQCDPYTSPQRIQLASPAAHIGGLPGSHRSSTQMVTIAALVVHPRQRIAILPALLLRRAKGCPGNTSHHARIPLESIWKDRG